MKLKKSDNDLDIMLSCQKLSQDKKCVGFTKNKEITSKSPNKPVVFVKEGQNKKSEYLKSDALGDATARHEHRSLSKNGFSSNVFVKPVVP